MDVDFIIVDAYSPYMAIVARPLLHALGVVSLNLHLKVKSPSGNQIEELVGSQSMARQCLVAVILHQPELSPQPLLRGAYSNQSLPYYLSMGQPRRRNVRI